MKIRGFLFLFSFYLVAQTDEFSDERYFQFSVDDVEAASSQENPQKIIENLGKRLNDFYVLDPSRKKKQQLEQMPLENFSEIQMKKEWDSNSRRIFLKKLLNSPIKPYHIKEAPNLFLAHFLMARAYRKLNNPYSAIYHFGQALRYRSLQMSEKVFFDDLRNRILNNGESRRAEQIQAIKKKEEQLKDELRDYEREQIVLEDEKRSPSLDRPISEISFELEELSKKIDQNKKALAEQTPKRKEGDQVYAEKETFYNQKSAAYLIEIAELVQKIEIRINQRTHELNKKRVNQINFHQALSSNSPKRKENKLYTNLLERANKLDPENLNLKLALARDHTAASRTWRAISNYEAIVPRVQELDQKIRLEVFGRLGGLYSDKKQYVQASFFYKKALKIQEDSGSNFSVKFSLAELYLTRSTNYDRAFKLLGELSSEMKNQNPTEELEQATWLRDRFQVARMLGVLGEKFINKNLVENSYGEALSIDRNLKELVQKQINLVDQKFDELQKIQKILKNREGFLEEASTKERRQFFSSQNEHSQESKKLQAMQSIEKSLPRKQIYFSLARHFEKNHNIDRAIITLETAEKNGISPAEARRQIDRLKKQY